MALTVTGAVLDGETVGLRCEDGRIAAIGPEVAPEPGDETIDAAGALLVAPLVNGHTHAAMTLFRGFGGDLPLMPWLRGADLAGRGEARRRGRLLGHAAGLRRDDPHRHHPLLGHVLAPGGDRAGGRRRRPAGDDRGAAVRRTTATPRRCGETALRSLEQLAELGPAVAPALAPHSIYTVSEDSLRWIAELGAERELPVQIHLSETEAGGRGLHRRPRPAPRRLPRPARAC